jgi:hypothetical protein
LVKGIAQGPSTQASSRFVLGSSNVRSAIEEYPVVFRVCFPIEQYLYRSDVPRLAGNCQYGLALGVDRILPEAIHESNFWGP